MRFFSAVSVVFAATILPAQIGLKLPVTTNDLAVAQGTGGVTAVKPILSTQTISAPNVNPSQTDARATVRRRSAHPRAMPQVQLTGPEEVLYTFQGTPDGSIPNGLIFDSSGNLYGTTQSGGTADLGAVFELSPNGSGGWKETVLYSFQGSGDGQNPQAGLIFDPSGNLYGTTSGSLTGCWVAGCGTVFELSPNGSGGWTETTLHTFQAGNDGVYPIAALVRDQAGNLYGTALAAGDMGCTGSDIGCGTVFELSPNGSGGWTNATLYAFTGGSDGSRPLAGLVLDNAGNLYGTAATGANPTCYEGCGVIFELSPNGNGGWTDTVLYTFQGGNDGGGPNSLVFESSGNLYCNTATPGLLGTIVELSPNGSGGWTETTIYGFQGDNDGESPYGTLVFDQSGNLYGATEFGGGGGGVNGFCFDFCGTVFELSPNGSGWTETILYIFQRSTDGYYPTGVILDAAGHPYGTAQGGKTSCCGVVFEVLREPFVTLSPASLSFGNQTLNIASPSQVTLTNSGNLPLDITTTQITGTNASEFANQTNSCSSSVVAPHTTCTISISFTPTALGSQTAALSITDNAPGSPQLLPISGSGVLPAVVLSPTSLSFGNQTSGSASSPQMISLANNGLGTLIITSLGITGASGTEFPQTNNCPSSLAPSSGCGISVTFSPNAIGSASASLTVVDNAPGSPQTLSLTGTGVTGISVSPATITFPNQYVGTSGLPQTVTVANNGNAVLTVNSVAASSADFAPLSSCGSPLQPGANCSIGVFFDPTTSGTRNGTLTITDTAAGSPQTVTLTGVGEDFLMASSSSSTATVTAGQTASYQISISPGGGFSQPVTLSCSGAPPHSTCALSSTSITLNGSSSVPVSVTVSTTGNSASLTAPFEFPAATGKFALAFGLPGLSGLALLGSFGRTRRIHSLRGLAILVLLSVMIWTACGSGSNSGGNMSSAVTPAGTYKLTVTGTFSTGSTTLTHTAKLALVVE
jgi:uncharacterized repeat protein (TIGR03803 family)